MVHQLLQITNPDQSVNQIEIHLPPVDDGQAVIVICPAMGVRGSYYKPLAEALTAEGFIGVVTDLRGLGHSSIRPSKKENFGYREMLDLDYQTILETVRDRFPTHKIYLLGHSLGGQLGCLFASRKPQILDGLILVACCSVYYKGWQGLGAYRTLFGTQLFRGIAKMLGYFPGDKIGFGGLAAQGVLEDWGQQAKTGKYIIGGDDFDYEAALKQLNSPVLAVSFAGDHLAPRNAVQNLYEKFQKPEAVLHRHLDADTGYTHFNWVKRPNQVITEIKEWLPDLV